MRLLSKVISFILIIAGYSQCFSSVKQTPDKIIILNQSPQLIYEIKQTPQGNELLIKQNGKLVSSLNQYALSELTESLIQIAYKVCTLKVRPDSVTVSLGIISATWNTKRLCKLK